ncbi:MAG TPA: beta-glucosidase BglX [Gemmatimonadaceae bacterium]
MSRRQPRPTRVRRALGTLAVLAACTTPVATPPATPAATPAAAPAAMPVRTAEDRFVDSLVALMTLEEKLGQLNQLSGMGDPTGPGGTAARAGQIRSGEIGSFLNIVGADTTRTLQRIAVEESRLGIPLLFALDVIHGYRTTFPVPLGEAATWDPSLLERSARVAATEAAAGGVHWTFAPMVDVARDARWGRVVEGAGEDPYLGRVAAVARVRGFQGAAPADLAAPNTIAATAKHFAAYGAAEAGRDYNIADIPLRTLHEVYLPPFHAAVCANVQTLMSSFNEIAGVPAHASPLLTDSILRRAWGFDGLVVSDWTGVLELLAHGVAEDRAAAGELALEAGVDVDMVSEIYRELGPLVRSGRVPQPVMDEAVRRVLRLKYRLGLFDDPYRYSDAAREAATMLTAEHRAAAREVARASIVLLKNDGNVLPLRRDLGTLAVIGSLAADSGAALGNWAGLGRAADAVSVLTGIRRAVSTGTRVLHAAGAHPEREDTSGIAAAVRVARQADAVVLVVGETPGMSAEAASRASVELPPSQQALAEAVLATGKPVVVVLMNGRPLALQWLHDHAPAILETWFLGVEQGTATADVLFGDHAPGGKLPVTFPRVTGQVPIYYNRKNTGRPPDEQQRFTSKYIDVSWTPLYPFGHGLSYTTFSHGAPRLSAGTMRPGDTLHVEVEVANAGRVAGDEVVQLYLRDEVASVTRPLMELRGFQRVRLAPGERRTVRFALDVQDLAFLDGAMRRVAEPGAFRVLVGGSSATTTEARFRFETMDGRPVPVAHGCEAVR